MVKSGRGESLAPVRGSKPSSKILVASKAGKSLDEPAPEEVLSIFGENLREARIQRGLTQAELGVAAGVSQRRMSGIESGNQNITARTMASLAKAVGVELCELLRRPR